MNLDPIPQKSLMAHGNEDAALPKIPNLQLAQWKFALLHGAQDAAAIREQFIAGIKADGVEL